MIKEYSGEFEFARLTFPASPEQVNEFSPESIASFTIGQQISEADGLHVDDISLNVLPFIRDIFGKHIQNSDMPQQIREGIPGIAGEIEPIEHDELALLKKVVHCWPRFGDEGSELYVRMDHIWTRASEPEGSLELVEVVNVQAETLFDLNPAA